MHLRSMTYDTGGGTRAPADVRADMQFRVQTAAASAPHHRTVAAEGWSSWTRDTTPFSADTLDDDLVQIELPSQVVLSLGPVPARLVDDSSTYGRGTASWLQHQTRDAGRTFPVPK